MNNIYTIDELKGLGVTIYGDNIKISKFTNIYNPSNLILYNNIRIDDFCVISCKGKIIIHNNVHISAQSFISSSTLIEIGNYSSISVGTKLFGSCDDFSGKYMVNPTLPSKFTNVMNENIIIKDHVVIGANSVCLPGIILDEGVAIGCNSFINISCNKWSIYAGTPIKFIKSRYNECKNLQYEYENENVCNSA